MDLTPEQTPERAPEVDDLEALVESGDETALRRFLALLHPADLAMLFETLDRDHWPRVLKVLPIEDLSDLLAELPDHLRDDLAEHLKPEVLADAVEEMSSDDAADVLADLPETIAEAVLAAIPSEDRHEVEALLKYPEDSAGGLMQMELVSVPETSTVNQAVEAIRERAEEVEQLHFVYLVDDGGRLTGVLPLEQLILHKPDTPVAKFAEREFFTVRPEVDQEEVAQMFGRYDLYSLAVVDAEGRLLGRILHDDIVDVLHEEHEEDILRAAGAEEPELVYTNRIFKIASVRLPWLLGNAISGLIAGRILYHMNVSFPSMLALIAFAPVIAGIGGNIGTQSSTIVVRGFATGRIDITGLGRYLMRELSIGSIMGGTCGLLIGLAARIWEGDAVLGWTVGIAMAVAITISALMGVLVPFFFRLVRIDPAISSGPLVASTNDIVGLSVYYGVAFLIIR